MSAPLVSVVVIGRNEGERLTRCLHSVRAMSDPGGPVELIYVDSSSTDDSVARARALGAEVLVVRPERPSAATGRNAGWRHAHAPFVLFLDGDTILDRAFVGHALFTMEQEPDAAIVWGHRREIAREASLYNAVLDLDWIYPPGASEFCGGDALVRRSVLEEVGGYDDTLIAGEEPEMCARMRARGHVILHVDLPMTGHDLAMTRFAQYWRRAFRAGHAYAEVSDRFRGTENELWLDDARRNKSRALMLMTLPVLGAVLSVAFTSVWPLLAVLALLVALVLRTAWRARWKSSHVPTLLLYGVHSHFQQIPIFFGQLGYRRDRRAGRQRRLIEYKEATR